MIEKLIANMLNLLQNKIAVSLMNIQKMHKVTS